MIELLGRILIVTFLVAVVGAIPFGIWIIVSLYQKRWKRAVAQIAILLLAFWGPWMGIWWVGEWEQSEHWIDVFDTDAELKEAIFRYDSSRDFNGDGYSFAVYVLPNGIRHRFAAADQRLLSQFPKRPGYRSHWRSEHWREAPAASEFQVYVSFALSRLDSDKEPALNRYYADVQNALSRSEVYYAFFVYEFANIDFFIVDLAKDRLYVINYNT